MSFNAKGLRRTSHGGANGNGAGSVKSMWHYASTDAVATVATSGYFNDATEQLSQGDVITCSLVLGGTPAIKQYIVTSVSGAAAVTVAAAA